MQEVFEKIVERLRQKKNMDRSKVYSPQQCDAIKFSFGEAIDIVQEANEQSKRGSISDGYHTFDELYHHRAILFSVICNQNKELAWKSKKHDTGDMYDGMFIVGIETPEGQATYHYDIEPYWDMFDVKELPFAQKWDRHTPDEAIRRISLLSGSDNGWIPCKVDMPKEHESVFAKFKGTDKWNNCMFEKNSDTVNVTVVNGNGMAVTTYARTVDGRWSCNLLRADKAYRIIAWKPFPAPYQE